MINLTIDNKAIQVPEGTTILKAARMNGIDIPTLCHFELDGMNFENKPGGCRVCVVEVKGRRNLAPACATDVMEGMEVLTHSARVINARKTVVELILSDHPNDCLQCEKNGDCELQSLTKRLGIKEIPFKGEQSHYRKDSTLSVYRDMDKCVMCRRCETMCNKFMTAGALSGVNRGFQAVVAPAFEQNLEQGNDGQSEAENMEQEKLRRQTRKIDLGEYADIPEDLSEEDRVTADMMQADGGRMDYKV